MSQVAYISNIQKFCVHDGPGIRTVVFFMGCPLRCKWCQNPENFSGKQVLMTDSSKCINCGACYEICKYTFNKEDSDGNTRINVDRVNCNGCGKCADVCLTGARTLCGKKMTVEEVYSEVIKDESFFKESGGGITLSGGEVTLYHDFAGALLEKFKQKGISTAVETCGYCSREAIKKIALNTDVFLYDIKLITSSKHKKWTGVDNKIILENLDYLLSLNKNVIVRIPLIPNVNNGDEFLRIIEFLKRYHNINKIHILPFHQIGSSKYKLIEEYYDMEDFDECQWETAELCKRMMEDQGFKANIGGWDC
ncbi:glycyl-radical enzyme activating protein [Clostridium tyrobutyricum]|uniref:glycyl-radical enzyme activating protein n=1 Tax=Clostridium tyrobutyricum TaxID=1519 RepID=UPI001C389554|nr:glycyl-radical enzyme activating protein [Clostridium tyrobutyricum]MBV4418858.1 glycyl-radical enzyme activating protein [Clostridium tyrobutyricum]